jgi:hypothetical protein
LGYRRARAAQIDGDLGEGEAFCSASGGLIREIMPAASVIHRLVNGYEAVVREFSSQT